MAAICTPTTSVEGLGTVDVKYIRQETEEVTTQYGERTNLSDIYTFTATPAAGWVFSAFIVTTTYDSGTYIETERETHETLEDETFIDDNPFSTVSRSSDTWQFPTWIGEYFGTGRYRPYYKTLTYHVVAIFYRPPTHLLVNSFNHSAVARLVYDPATHRLVADY